MTLEKINSELETQKIIKKILKENNMGDFENLKKLAGVDNVNHPAHYCREDAMECIDEMVLIFGKDVVKNFCLCNAWKYRYRASDKNGIEDLKKSDWYIKKYKELCEEKSICKIEDDNTAVESIEWDPRDNGYHVRTTLLGHNK